MKIREHSKIMVSTTMKTSSLEDLVRALDIAKITTDCLWVEDSNKKIVYVNPSYEKTLDYSLEELLGKPSDFCFDTKLKKMLKNNSISKKEDYFDQTSKGTITTKSGEKIPGLIRLIPTKSNHVVGVFGNLEKSEELTKKERLTQKILQHTIDAIVVLDKDRNIKLWNSGAEKMFEHKEEDILNKCIDIVIPPEEINKNSWILQETERRGHVNNIETRRMTKSKTRIDVMLSATKVEDKAGNFLGYLITYHDITAQKRTREELQKRFESIQDSYKELGLQKRQLDYFCEIAQSAKSEESLEKLEYLIVSALCMLTKFDGVILREYDKKDNALILKHCFGVSKNWWTKGKVPFKNSLAEEAFNKKRPLIIDNIFSHAKHKSTVLVKSHNFKTLILLPLFVDGKILGSISLYAKDTNKLRFIETDFLENFATQCSIAINSKKNSKPSSK
jgi:PAS domain S-box-containing protein